MLANQFKNVIFASHFTNNCIYNSANPLKICKTPRIDLSKLDKLFLLPVHSSGVESTWKYLLDGKNI